MMTDQPRLVARNAGLEQTSSHHLTRESPYLRQARRPADGFKKTLDEALLG